MSKPESLIDQLYTDSGPFVRALKSVLAIQRGEHFVHFKREVPLKTEEKILAYALVKKLLAAEGIDEQSGFSGKEVHTKTGIPQGTVDPTIQKLKKDGAVPSGMRLEFGSAVSSNMRLSFQAARSIG